MSLTEDLQQFSDKTSQSIPPEISNVMKAANYRLKISGIEDTAMKAGNRAPSFSLPNVTGNTVSSEQMLDKGPVVLSFYRGGW